LSFQDALTGIFNRTYFEAEMKRLESYGNYPISVILMDVDGLKLVNDRHGHAAGDVLLKELARVIQDVFRAGDVAARIGGDEFGILLENMDEKGAKRAVDRLRSAIAAHNETSIKAAEDNPALEWSLSASIGSATSTARRHLTDILKEADTRMYQEKRDKKMQRIN
jgi:diguanylate cyclase (GGDEF)-like protein